MRRKKINLKIKILRKPIISEDRFFLSPSLSSFSLSLLFLSLSLSLLFLRKTRRKRKKNEEIEKQEDGRRRKIRI